MTINDFEYYESNIVNASDAQGDLTRNPETFTHTSNVNFGQKLLSNRIIPVVVPTMNVRINQRIAPIVMVPHMILAPATKEVVTSGIRGK